MGKGSGSHLHRSVREIIYHMIHDKHYSAEDIWGALFEREGDVPHIITKDRCQRIYNMILDPCRVDETSDYVGQKRPREGNCGRPKLMSEEAKEFLSELIAEKRCVRIRVLNQKFTSLYYENPKTGPCDSTLRNTMKRDMDLSRKKMQRVHRRADPEEGVRHLDAIASYNPWELVSIDGMVNNRADFRGEFGWSEKGKPCVHEQIYIGKQSYAVMAACDPTGIICYEIYTPGTGVTGAHVAAFLTNVGTLVDKGNSFCILDNASNQSTEEVEETLDDVFGPLRWKHLPAYSPKFAPIEKVFAAVKKYIKDREAQGERDPVGLIQEALEYYSYRGLGGPSGMYLCIFFIVLSFSL